MDEANTISPEVMTQEERTEILRHSLSLLLTESSDLARTVIHHANARPADHASLNSAYLGAARLAANLLRAKEIETRLRQSAGKSETRVK